MKRILSVLLTLAFLLPAAAFTEPAEALSPLPEVGDVICGFEVVERGELPLVQADTVYFVHQKTGAELLYLANEDTNRVFELTFRTPSVNDKGVPHVFEHSTLSGSKEYPSQQLFFNLSYQTYNTYMNALTYNHMTTYPVASLSEAQLLKYADFYVSCCLHPIVLEDESIFREEAWRYVLSDAEDDLTLAGTVYSEMLGAYNKDRAANLNYLKTLFPGSTASNESGGLPTAIPDMTWEDLKAYHEAYYHPSNSMACLYGSFDDYAAFLRLLDAYYSNYEARAITIQDDLYTPIEASEEVRFDYPVSQDQDTSRSTSIYFGMVCDPADSDVLDLLTLLLNSDASQLMQDLRDAIPYGRFSCSCTLGTPEPSVYVNASNVEPDDAELFRNTVLQAFAKTAEDGFDPAMIEAVNASIHLETSLITESSSVGVSLLPSLFYYWALDDNVNAYAHSIETLDNIERWNNDGTFIAAIQKNLLGNERTALVTTTPVAGLEEELAEQEKTRLANIKAAMSEEELAAIIEATNAPTVEEDSSAYVQQLQAVTVESLPEEMRQYTLIDETGDDGVRRMNVEAGVDGVGEALLMLDTAGFPQEDLHWLNLYLNLIGNLDTSKHTRAELTNLQERYLYEGEIRISALNAEDSVQPKVRASWIAEDADMEDAYALVGELLFDTRLDDGEKVLNEITSMRSALKQQINNAPYQIQIYRMLARSNPAYAYYTYVNHLDFYEFLTRIETEMTEDPTPALEALRKIQTALNNRVNAVSGFVGSAESAEIHRAVADAFLAGLDASPIEPVKYDLPQPNDREGLITESAVMYNMLYADYDVLGLDAFTGDLDAVTSLVADVFLYPLLRDQYGAYSVLHAAMDDGVYICTYRDPGIAQTFDVYDSLPELIADMELDQETLDGYILSSYSAYALSTGELAGGFSWMLNVLNGDDPTEVLEYMHALKSIRAEDLPAYAELYSRLAEHGLRSTSGNAGQINANADLFDVILNPFQAQDTSAIVFDDLAEDDPAYSAVRYAFESGMLLPISETSFGMADTATGADLAGALYRIIGGEPGAPEAMEVLQSYGILAPELANDTALTREDAAYALYDFTIALGIEPAEASLDVYADGEGTESAAGWAVALGMLPARSAEGTPALALEEALTRGELAVALSGYMDYLDSTEAAQ